MRMRKEKGTVNMKLDIVRAWKDEAYRQQLSSEHQALLPANPVGELELSDAELEAIHGTHSEEEVENKDKNFSHEVGLINFAGCITGTGNKFFALSASDMYQCTSF